MKRLSIAVVLLLVFTFVFGAVGCKTTTTTPTPTLTPTATATPTPISTPTLTLTPTPTHTTAALFLSVTQPQDQSIVNKASIVVSGSTIPGAVVSISVNDSIYIPSVDNNGHFTISVILEEGPNLIEVVASDAYGNQKSVTIDVVYTS